MTTFLFWNLNRKPLQAIVTNLALRYDVDVLILTECTIEPDVLLRNLNWQAPINYHYAPSIGCKTIEIFTRFSDQFMQPVYETDRFSARHLQLPEAVGISLVSVHFPSKLHWSDQSQAMECVELADLIRLTEEIVGHSKTVLVGDLNMNPFEDGVVSARGLHGVMSRSIAEKKTRTVQGKEYPFFYNPMWGLFGDRTPGPPGTYYYTSSEQRSFFWNIFDQVLIRPNLLPFFDSKALEIVQSDGDASLVSPNGLPDTNAASDHLPVFFRLEL